MTPRERFPHDDPREWMNRAHSNLARAKLWAEDVYLDAAVLTRYAAVTRYPGHTRPVTNEDHREAVKLANRVVQWVEGIL